MPSEKEIMVHTMPKRFLGPRLGVKKARGIGLIVLIGGLLALAGALAFLYFYLSQSDDSASIVTMAEPAPEPTAETELPPPAATIASEMPASEETPAAATAEPEETVTDSDAGIGATTTTATTTAPEIGTSTRVIGTGATTTEPAGVRTATDGDGDGLTDVEEVLLDGNIGARDSDGDGYEDLAEITNFYNPAGAGSLIANPNIEKYINRTYDYVLYYPYIWPADSIGGDDSVMFTLGNNQFIQFIVQPNPDKKSLDSWFMEQLGLTAVPESARLYKKGWWALKGSDGLTVYLARPDIDQIFIAAYNLGTTNTLLYPNIFELMVKSLEIEN